MTHIMFLACFSMFSYLGLQEVEQVKQQIVYALPWKPNPYKIYFLSIYFLSLFSLCG